MENGHSSPQEFVGSEIIDKQHRTVSTFFSGILNGFLIILFSLSIEVALVVIFFHTVSSDLDIRSFWGIDGEAIREFMTSIYPLLLCSLFLLVFLVLLILKNRKKVKIFFLSIGIAFGISGVTSLLVGLFCPQLINLLPGVIRDVICETANALGELMLVSAIILCIFSSLFISLFLVITYIKRGDKHE